MATIAALRRSLENVGARAHARNGDLTLVIPDAAVRVLLLDFDSLPNKLSEALPIVRFRLKKLLPFEADDAMVSFQIMSTSRTVVRVLAVAIPRDVLSEYESVAREAGFEPGAVLAGLHDADGASLVVNAHTSGVTTAIVRNGILQLHRTVELAGLAAGTPADFSPTLFERSSHTGISEMLPLVDREDTAGEWAAQQPSPEHGRNPYADRVSAEAAVEDVDGITGLPSPGIFVTDDDDERRFTATRTGTAPARYPYAAPGVLADLTPELHNAVLQTPTPSSASADVPSFTESAAVETSRPTPRARATEPVVQTLAPDVQAAEIAQAVSVAVAYFEDSLGAPPATLLSAGPLGADSLNRILEEQGVAQTNGLRTRELVDTAAFAPGALTASLSRGWLAGVVGALRS